MTGHVGFLFAVGVLKPFKSQILGLSQMSKMSTVATSIKARPRL